MAVNTPEKVEHQEKHHGARFSLIPEELKREKRWVNWKLVPRKGEPGKFQKLPINSKSGSPASCSDPKTWSTFQAAVLRFKQGDVDGIGFGLGEPYVGIDIDDCRDSMSGRIEDWAKKIFKPTSTYTEISPSETGLHIILKGHSERYASCSVGGIKA